MAVDLVSPLSLRQALSAIRHPHASAPLEASPLLDLALLDLRLLADGVVDTRENRAWALGSILDEIVWERLCRLRGPGDGGEGEHAAGRGSRGDRAPALPPQRSALTPQRERELLRQDFAAGLADREAWGILFTRYLSTAEISMREVEALVGIGHSTLARRLHAGVQSLTAELRQREAVALKSAPTRPGAPSAERIVVRDMAPTQGTATHRAATAAVTDLVDAIRSEDRVVHLSPAELAAIGDLPVHSLEHYRLSRIAEWSQPRFRLDERFVNLTLLLDLGEDSLPGRWKARDERYPSLLSLLETTTDPAFVVLGPPGAGKSTLLRRLELDLAIQGIRDAASALPFFIQLNQFPPLRSGQASPSPKDWLAERWRTRYPQLPPLETLLGEGRMLLLLDGLNEVPAAEAALAAESVAVWKRFVQALASDHPGNRAVFSCRSLDYSQPLSSPALRVPQIQVQPLSDTQIETFLRCTLPRHAEAVWASLEAAGQIEIMRCPFHLKLVAGDLMQGGELPVGRAALYTGFVRQALVREIEQDNPLFTSGALLQARDLHRIAQARQWRSAWELPERSLLVGKISELAFGMQASRSGPEQSQLRISYDAALTLLNHERADEVLRAAAALGIVDEDVDRDELYFVHQLVQEYFAARRLAAQPRPELLTELLRVEWRRSEIVPSVRDVIAGLDPADPLPPPAGTGWEETAILASVMAEDPAAFIADLMRVNLPLAGRCLQQVELRERLATDLLDTLRRSLVERSRDPEADLRVRIDCAHIVAELGDPRFPRRAGPHGDYIVPLLVDVPGAVYPIGDDAPITAYDVSFADHVPRRSVHLAPFALGQFAVTNAEWACFVEAGGYDDERWWPPGSARAWQSGQTVPANRGAEIRYWLSWFRAEPSRLRERFATGIWPEDVYALWMQLLEMSDSEIDQHLRETHRTTRSTEPRFWRLSPYNHPAQPVVGICFFEAQAYCRWLSAQTDLPFRLPTEAEWEAAARGESGRRFSYGNRFDALCANTFETHVRRPTPVGVFPAGDTPAGHADMTGNTFDWTVDGPGCAENAGGAQPNGSNGPEAAAVPGRLAQPPCQAVRGGSWHLAGALSQTVFRQSIPRGIRNAGVGMRLVLGGREEDAPSALV